MWIRFQPPRVGLTWIPSAASWRASSSFVQTVAWRKGWIWGKVLKARAKMGSKGCDRGLAETYNGGVEPMPTVLLVQGWRLYFYSNEGNEPMHVHAIKGDAECKYWLHPDRFDIGEEFAYNCAPRLRREIRQII